MLIFVQFTTKSITVLLSAVWCVCVQCRRVSHRWVMVELEQSPYFLAPSGPLLSNR